MPQVLLSLLGGLIGLVGPVVSRVLIALGIGAVTYTGFSQVLGQLEALFMSYASPALPTPLRLTMMFPSPRGPGSGRLRQQCRCLPVGAQIADRFHAENRMRSSRNDRGGSLKGRRVGVEST